MPELRVGLVLPFGADDVVRFAQEAERLGFDYVAAPEHLAFHAPVPNSFVWLAAAAGATTTIGLLSSVILAPLYPPVLLAKLTASLDYVSGGRLHLGLGVGGEYPPEFAAAGVPIAERGPRTDEAIEVINALLGHDVPIDYEGRWTSVEGIDIAPRRRGHRPPLWIGGRQRPAMRRAARFADVWMPYMFTPEETEAGRATLQELAVEAGRDVADIEVAIYSFACVSDDEQEARTHAVQFTSSRYKQDFTKLSRKFLLGDPARIAQRMNDYVAAGASTFILELACPTSEVWHQMERIANEVIPLVQARETLIGMEG